MNTNNTRELIESLKDIAKQILQTAKTEEEAYQVEQAIHQEVSYIAGLTQAELVKPEQGWDPFGR